MADVNNLAKFTQIEEENRKICSFADELGSSTKIYYQVFPGVCLVHLEVHRPHLIINQEHPAPNFIEIGYCKEGCMELGDSQSQLVIVPGDITVHCKVPLNGEIHFPQQPYQAISVVIDLDQAPQEVLSMLEDFELDLSKMILKYRLDEKSVYVLKQAARIAMLFEEMHAVAGVIDVAYQKIKVVEILLRIRDFCLEEGKRARRSVSDAQKSIAQEVYQHLVAHPRERNTIASLARMFSVSQTQLKEGFRAVYGQSVYAFACEVKMRAAAQVLLETDMKVTDVATQFGYANTSKFSSAFQRVMGKTPMKYRNQHKER